MGDIKHWIDMLLHADNALKNIVGEYKNGTYFILFLIIFCETGLVITPFLPGDSLLFAAGAIAGSMGVLNVPTLVILLFIAAFAGDNSNYFIGRYFGPKIFNMNLRFINKSYLERTHQFYEKHGGKTIIAARFMPIIRTFAPFVAGIGSMRYPRFVTFSIIGNLIWINLFTWAGYGLGENPWVKTHFTLVTFLIIGVSLIPAVYGAFRGLMAKKKQ
jgi:membrane-associated protein